MNRALSAVAALLFATAALAADFPDNATIYLVDSKEVETRIGEVSFTPVADGSTAVSVTMDHSVFSEHFLSMRPFRCLEDESEWFCYLEYPYDLRRLITTEDLSDLEYQLLFIKKLPTEFGIDAWNGLYYKLAQQSDGSIHGELLEGDLNVLQSPPAKKFSKPVDLSEFIEADPVKRLFPKLRIY